ncbi:MAG: response regulator [Faecalicoccus sp.]|uniref:response regulator transcription factor n=1 Tax=Faecalicoccus TaxID=1573536 RepID=UPI00232DE643|nr:MULTISPECIES: response regulator [Faecalicoccus]MCI6378939.1 response regulator [Erysipelotrichaceae bacterium]MDB7989901.1 response regulator [Faecalicoccus pleomorphus]MDB7994387.1 response regulator [Faecalicoccus pleomorphus]MDY4869264.1 response regulator [Faecalicoccus sp.]
MYRVVVIEDEEAIRKGIIMSIDFSALNCILIGEASNGVEGIKLIQEKKPDIVITDVTMPLMSGIEMIEQTLEYNYTSIIISGYDEFSYAKKAIKLGVCDYLMKPIDKEELNNVIQSIVSGFDLSSKISGLLKEKNQIEHIQLLETLNKEDHLVDKIMEYIHLHYSEKIFLSDIADVLNYSESLLSKRFRRVTQMTFNEYLNRFRIQKSIEYMKKGTYGLTEISDICGFSDYKYFSTVFKKYTGYTPSQFTNMIVL